MVDLVVTARGTTGEEILDIRNPLGEIVADVHHRHYTDGGCQFGNNFYLGTTIVHCEGSFRFESAPTNVGQN